MRAVVGYAHFFESTVIFCESVSDLLLSTRGRSGRKHGSYVGTVKGLIPVDESRVLYVYHHHTKAFKERQRLRRFLRKHGITRLELRENRKLTEFDGRKRRPRKRTRRPHKIETGETA